MNDPNKWFPRRAGPGRRGIEVVGFGRGVEGGRPAFPGHPSACSLEDMPAALREFIF